MEKRKPKKSTDEMLNLGKNQDGTNKELKPVEEKKEEKAADPKKTETPEEKEDSAEPKFDPKNIDIQGFLNPLINKDIKVTKASGIEITGTLRTITPNNQLLVLIAGSNETATVYRDSIAKIELLE